MKFTHLLNIHEGWIKTTQTPSDFKKVKHLGACSYDGDMFAAYDNKDAIIEIFKGTMEDNHVWTNPTEEEVEENLIKLAKKKGFKNIHKLRIKDPYGDVYEKGEFIFGGNEFTFNNNILFLDDVEIFRNGKWAEILEEEPLTILNIEERLKRLEDKLL